MSKSEQIEKARKIIQDLTDTLKESELTYIASVGEDSTFACASGIRSPMEMSAILASVIMSAGETLLQNEGFELYHLADILTDATNMAFEKLGSEKKEGNLIVGPWGKRN